MKGEGLIRGPVHLALETLRKIGFVLHESRQGDTEATEKESRGIVVSESAHHLCDRRASVVDLCLTSHHQNPLPIIDYCLPEIRYSVVWLSYCCPRWSSSEIPAAGDTFYPAMMDYRKTL